MWFHKSRSVPKREKRCDISFLNFGFTRLLNNIDVDLPNKKTNIEFEKFFENKGIDCDNAFNFQIPYIDEKQYWLNYNFNIFNLPLVESEDNNSIYIGIKKQFIQEDILCVKKDNNIRYYLLLPYFKVNKDNLEEGKYVNKHTQMSYHLGLFEIQIQGNILTSAILIDTISIKDKITLDEFYNDFLDLKFSQKEYKYVGSSRENYILVNKLTNCIYFFNFFDITNPKIGNIYCDKYNIEDIEHSHIFVGNFHCNKGRWFFQFKLNDYKYFVKDNCDGKYEKIEILKENDFNLNKDMILYDKQNNPYFPYENNYTGKLKEDKDINIYSLNDSDFNKLPFYESKNRYLKFQFTPFNNLNLVYYYQYNDVHDLYEYSIIPEIKCLKNIYELNPNGINNKYKINSKYKNIYHRYLYYLDDEKRVPYVQVWKDEKINQAYGIILNMRGKWGVFDKEIIEEK